MRRHGATSRSDGRLRALRCVALAAAIGIGGTVLPEAASADEGGVSFWVPGLFGSLAAAPLQAGWQFAAFNYYTNISGNGAVAASRQITVGKFTPTIAVNLNANLHADANLTVVNPTYVFATPVFGGQLSVGVLGTVGNTSVGVAGALTASAGGFAVSKQGVIGDTTAGYGDLIPIAMLRWNSGIHNYMVYGTGDIPIGTYDSNQLANLGIGHGTVDGGFGYTYFDPKLGQELSFVTGATYNLVNESTGYQNGIDWHLDWGMSQFLSQQFFLGAVGYVYKQVTPDRGVLPQLAPFESQVVGFGPQIGFIIPSGSVQTFLGFKAYAEFFGNDRPSGWNGWVTLSFSPTPQAAAEAKSNPMATKAGMR
jgi:hypothetical protein